jgi:hypothetical protein
VVNSPGVILEDDIRLRFVRGLTLNLDGTLKKASESRPVQFKGDSSGGRLRDLEIEVVPVPYPNQNIPAAIQLGTSTGVELHNIRVRGPAGIVVYTGSPSLADGIAPVATF